MDLKKFNFRKLNGVELVFSSLKTDHALLAEARYRGFYLGHTKYNTKFSDLFFKGGVIECKKNLPDQFKTDTLWYLKAFASSFYPKHEEKEAICAMLLSELCD